MKPLEFTIKLAKDAGRLLLNYYHKANLQINIKSDNSIVTQADKDIDIFIKTHIQKQFPTDTILSEELNPSFLPNFKSSNFTWIVDPLDGTSNFSLGLAHWGVLITRLKNGHPYLTVQYFPLIDELYIAQTGLGAMLNNKPIHVQENSHSRPYTVFSTCSRTFKKYDVSIPYKLRVLGSAAYSFCLIARGSAIVAFEATPKIWDIAGAWLLVQEAGGFITPYRQSPPFPLQSNLDYTTYNFPTVAAANLKTLNLAVEQIKPKT